MIISKKSIKFSTNGNFDIVNITSKLQKAVTAACIEDGIVNIFAPGATGAITAIECENGLLEDFRDFFEKIIPADGEYKHNLSHAGKNGHSHVRASLREGKAVLGVWQSVIFIDADSCPRDREIMITVIGDAGKN